MMDSNYIACIVQLAVEPYLVRVIGELHVVHVPGQLGRRP